jgi:hypothetical protein
MRSWKSFALLALLMTMILVSAEAQQRTYQSFNGNVPFSFNIGERKFHSGYYEFIVAAPGIMLMRDAHQHPLATLLIREIKGIEREVAPRMVFDQGKHRTRLLSIWMPRGAQGFEILREDVPAPRIPPPSVQTFTYQPLGGRTSTALRAGPQ